MANSIALDCWMEIMNKKRLLLAMTAMLFVAGCSNTLSSSEYAILKTVQHADGNRPALPGEVRSGAIEGEHVKEGITDALIRSAEQKTVEAISK